MYFGQMPAFCTARDNSGPDCLREDGKMDAAVAAAREILSKVTPLKRDCGRVCGARCCRSLDGEETGMLLFPGEAASYTDKAGWTIQHTALGDMVICPGRCDREERPLSCRLFPLLPMISGAGEIRAVTDLRAQVICPLARQGKSAMAPAFIDAVREAGEVLARSGEQAEFLKTLAEEQEQLRNLRKQFTMRNEYGGDEV